MDDVVDGGLRQSLMIASRITETLARRRQESQRQQEHQRAQVAHEAQARLAAERSAAHAALAPVEKDQWWDKAQPYDIATAHAVAEGWKDHDPTALAASEKIRQEVLSRYGIDTHDVGTDAAYRSKRHYLWNQCFRAGPPHVRGATQRPGNDPTGLRPRISRDGWSRDELQHQVVTLSHVHYGRKGPRADEIGTVALMLRTLLVPGGSMVCR